MLLRSLACSRTPASSVSAHPGPHLKKIGPPRHSVNACRRIGIPTDLEQTSSHQLLAVMHRDDEALDAVTHQRICPPLALVELSHLGEAGHLIPRVASLGRGDDRGSHRGQHSRRGCPRTE